MPHDETAQNLNNTSIDFYEKQFTNDYEYIEKQIQKLQDHQQLREQKYKDIVQKRADDNLEQVLSRGDSNVSSHHSINSVSNNTLKEMIRTRLDNQHKLDRERITSNRRERPMIPPSASPWNNVVRPN